MANSLFVDAFRLWEYGKTGYQGQCDLDSDAIYIVLVDSTSAAESDATKQGHVYESDINSHEISGTGYTARGQALTSLSLTNSSHVVTWTADNPVWTTSTFSAAGCYIIFHKSTAATSPLICYLDFGGNVTVTAANFTVVIDPTHGMAQIS